MGHSVERILLVCLLWALLLPFGAFYLFPRSASMLVTGLIVFAASAIGATIVVAGPGYEDRWARLDGLLTYTAWLFLLFAGIAIIEFFTICTTMDCRHVI
jgi:hypothetical protein